MKIGVYTIAKNEAKHVERWCNTSSDADYRFVLDTGSTDNTVDLLEARGVPVQMQVYKPFRFDRARQDALMRLPQDTDVCISLDMDETLVPGWRDGQFRPGHVTQGRVTWANSRSGKVTGAVSYLADLQHHDCAYVRLEYTLSSCVGASSRRIWIDLTTTCRTSAGCAGGFYVQRPSCGSAACTSRRKLDSGPAGGICGLLTDPSARPGPRGSCGRLTPSRRGWAALMGLMMIRHPSRSGCGGRHTGVWSSSARRCRSRRWLA